MAMSAFEHRTVDRSSISNFSDFISLYPNPNGGHFTLETETEMPVGQSIIKTLTQSGNVVHEEVMDDTAHMNNIDISNPSGSTFLC